MRGKCPHTRVIPAKGGIQTWLRVLRPWIPACAGMTSVRMRRLTRLVLCASLAALLGDVAVSWAGESYGIGRTATPEEIAGWNIDVAPDGAGLPPGHGGVDE